MESEKTSKNKRKFDVHQNAQLFQALEQCTQLATTIEDKCSEQTGPEDLPTSMIPTAILYNIAACFVEMYNKLLDEKLLVAGYPKSDTSRTH